MRSGRGAGTLAETMERELQLQWQRQDRADDRAGPDRAGQGWVVGSGRAAAAMAEQRLRQCKTRQSSLLYLGSLGDG